MINERLLKKAKYGDGNSFYKLLEPVKKKMYKVAYAYTNNEHDALDCIQESIIKAIESIDKLKEPRYFYTWIMKITVNTCKDYIKKNRKIILYNIDDYKEKITVDKDQYNNIGDIDDLLKNLTFKERELIIMRYLDDMSLNDISSRTHRPLGTIKSSISRTLKKIRRCVEAIE